MHEGRRKVACLGLRELREALSLQKQVPLLEKVEGVPSQACQGGWEAEIAWASEVDKSGF